MINDAVSVSAARANDSRPTRMTHTLLQLRMCNGVFLVFGDPWPRDPHPRMRPPSMCRT